MASIKGIYRGVDSEALILRRDELLSQLAKANGRSSRSWTDGNVSTSESYNFSALRDELAEIQYELSRRGINEDSDTAPSKLPGAFVPPGERLF